MLISSRLPVYTAGHSPPPPPHMIVIIVIAGIVVIIISENHRPLPRLVPFTTAAIVINPDETCTQFSRTVGPNGVTAPLEDGDEKSPKCTDRRAKRTSFPVGQWANYPLSLSANTPRYIKVTFCSLQQNNNNNNKIFVLKRQSNLGGLLRALYKTVRNKQSNK